MLQVWWEEESQDHIHSYLGGNKLKLGWSLWDGEQEDVSFLVGSFSIIRTPESIFDQIDSKEGSKAVRILCFGLFWGLVSEEFLPSNDGAFQFDFFFAVFLGWDSLSRVDQEKHNRLRSHHVLLDVGEERSVTIIVEQVEHFFLGQDLLHLMEHIKVIFLQLLEYTV
jgi:hypothetical protein